MKKFLPFLASLFLASVSWGQTGNGVLLLTDASYTYTPTTVDSSMTFNLSLKNDVGIAQVVYFGGLDAPFELSSDAPIEVPSQDTVDFSITFTPSAIGTFSDTLEVLGSIFGSASLILSGDGIQVQLEWSAFTATFGNTAIGETSFVDIEVTNVGDGVATLDFEGSQSDVFDIEFITDTIIANTGSFDDVVHYPFYVTVVPSQADITDGFEGTIFSDGAEFLGSNGSGSQISFNESGIYNDYTGASFGFGDLVEVNLPANDCNNGLTGIQFLSYGCHPGTQVTIQDQFGEIVLEFISTTDCGDFYYDCLELSSPLTPGVLQENETQIARVSFSPTDAGENTDVLSILTNSPTLPEAIISCSGFAVSEISGNFCDASWTLANAPYTFVGDVNIPEDCHLTIEAGVDVEMNGYDLIVDGSLSCIGTAELPITIEGGLVALNEGPYTTIKHTKLRTFELDNSPYDLIYENRMATTADVREFDCFSNGTTYTGNNMDGSNGCDYFDFQTSSSYSNQKHEDDSYLRFYSVDYDGHIYLASPPTAPTTGSYSFSFTFETQRFERNCSLYLEVLQNGSWERVWSSRSDLESNSQLTYFASGSGFFTAGQPIEFRIFNDIGSTSTDYDEMYALIDDVRIERQRQEKNIVRWEFDSPDYAEFWENLGQQFGSQVFLNGDTLNIFAEDQDVEFNTQNSTEAPIIVPETGWYFFRVHHKNSKSDNYSRHRMYYRVNNGSEYRIIDGNTEYGSASGAPTYDWRDDLMQSFEPLNEGDRIDFRFINETQSTNSSEDEMDWSGTRIEILQFDDIPVTFSTASLQAQRPLLLDKCEVGTISSSNELAIRSSSALDVHHIGEKFVSVECDLIHLETIADSVEITNCVIDPADGYFDHGLILTAKNILLEANQISNHSKSGIFFPSSEDEGDCSVITEDNTIFSNRENGIHCSVPVDWSSISDSISSNSIHGVELKKQSTFTATGITISSNEGSGGLFDSDTQVLLDYALIDDNGGSGLEIRDDGALTLNNSRIRDCGAEGIYSASPVTINHSNLAYNNGTGLVLTGNNFHTLNNSILWGNNSSNYTQIDIGGGVISTSYSTVQGRSSYGTSGSGQYYWGEGVIEADPLFSDDDLHLEIFSPCVDGGQPWHQDAYMPFGLGGVRADMGMYGGPDNAYWGGEALPDGASALTGVSDSPQDQGGVVGLVFDASFYDNSDLVNNVTSYAFWRHYDPTGQSIGTLDEGNWELIGEMPAQSFNGYAFQAQTLGNTNAFGTFNSCYTVVAQTDDPDTYWYSNVMCGESVDNLAPMEPELAGMVLETGGVTVFWELPSEEDYAYTEVTSDAGFTAEVTGDTLAVDLSAELGGTYTYTAVHYDVNGNASDPSSVTLAVAAGSDIITLNAGWNLISTDREETLNVEDVFAGLTPGNLQYVTGFDGGVQFYDPNGLSFLNTLNVLTPGKGYWVKVAADDVLEVSGARLDEGFMPALAEGWNLIGYAPEAPQAPGTFFAELEAVGDLLYVTGFDQGTQLYNPNGLPFLNTLSEMRNGYGYWVKSAAATEAGVFSPLAEDALLAEQPTPLYDVVNGVSELKSYAGEFVDVLNGWGVTVARLPILEGGHLMTTALFGDDPATAAVEGLVAGETLYFAFRGAMANEQLVFGGDMAHKTLTLTFDEVGAAMGVFPNPASDVATFRFQVDMDAQVEVTLVDLAGRQVAVLLDANKGQGTHAETLTLPTLEAGAYTVQLRVAGEVTSTQRLVITH